MPIADVMATFRWWLVLFLIGAAATPLAYRLFSRLPDRGYAFVKMAGLLIISFIFWLFGSLGTLGNNLGGILLSCGVLVGLSVWAYTRPGPSLPQWLRENWRYVLLAEGVFLLIFLLWAWVRAQNPAIVATEKPMEFAFLNSVGRSPTFPPNDPWLSGFSISYYYFGYVMTSVIARLAAVPEAIAFNLGLAWLAAGTGVGAFGLVYNLLASERFANIRRLAVGLGLVASLALPLAGNMQVLLEVLHGNGVGPAEFWAWLDIRDINGPPDSATEPRYASTHWWWWRSSRVIHEYHLGGRPEEGLEPIAEFPGFSFILGDMHPHVLALPFAFLSLAVALNWWLRPDDTEDDLTTTADWDEQPLTRKIRLLGDNAGWPLLLFSALVLGGLSFLNTWDVLIHLFVIITAFLLAQWRSTGRWHSRYLQQTVLLTLMLVIPAILLYLPFYLGFRSQAGPPFLLPTLMQPTRLIQYLVIFGMPLFTIVLLLGTLIVQTKRLSWRIMLFTAVGLVLVLFLLMAFLGWIIAVSGSGPVTALANEVGLVLPPPPEGNFLAQLGWGLQVVVAILPTVILSRLQSGWLIWFLALSAGAVVMLWVALLNREVGANGTTPSEKAPPVQDEQVDNAEIQPADLTSPAGSQDTSVPTPPSTAALGALPFVLLLVLTGVLLSLGPEFVYLKDNFGQRLNTIFKFYYQTWVVFGVAALYGLGYLWHRSRAIGAVAVSGYGLLFLVAMLFPYFAATSRAGEYADPPTLDGTAQLAIYNPDEYAAFMWLRNNAGPEDVIVEAVGGQYSTFGRVSATTGLPTLLGWAGHEYQWRGDTPEPAAREPAVRQIYAEPDWNQTAQYLNQYDVTYVYLGPQEIRTYGPEAREKLGSHLEVAYANNNVIIYHWLPPD